MERILTNLEKRSNPNFFIVGAPKCGTTAMDKFLGEHPEIYMSPVKELHYFGSDLRFHTPRLSFDDYLSKFNNVASEKHIGESSVWYLYSKEAASEIKSMSPSSKIIIMLRNPVEMIPSLHSQLVYEGYENIADLKTALDVEGERKTGRLVPPFKNTSMEFLLYKDTAKYSNQIKRFIDIFGSENVLIIDYEDFKNDTARIYRETLQFLGVSCQGFRPDFRVVNPNKNVRFLYLQSFIKNPQNRIRTTIKKIVPKSIRKLLLTITHQLNTVQTSRTPLSPDLRKQLQCEFVQEVKDLGILLNRNFSFWLN